jgi:hypothetical protein
MSEVFDLRSANLYLNQGRPAKLDDENTLNKYEARVRRRGRLQNGVLHQSEDLAS